MGNRYDRTRNHIRQQIVIFLGGIPLYCLNGMLLPAVAQTSPIDRPSLLLQVLQSIELQQQITAAALKRQLNSSSPTPLLPVPPRIAPKETALDPRWNQYQLGPGDTIFIQVEPPFQNLSLQSTLSPEGTIVVPLVGTLNLEELSPNEAAGVIRGQLNRFVVEPIVSVTLLAQRPAQATITGEVLRPGFYPLPANTTPSTAILAAGGATLDADLRQVLVRRTLPNGTILQRQIDLYTPLRQGSPVPEFNLQDGDAIVVPQRQTDFNAEYDRDLIDTLTLTAPPQFPLEITIIGEVARPGFYPVAAAPPPDVAQAILVAGGTRVTANLRQVLVRRTLIDGSTVEETVDLFTPLLAGTPLPDFRLEDGDVVVVPTLDLTDQAEYDRQLVARSTLAQQQIRVRILSYPAGGGGSFNIVNLPNTSTLLDALQGVPLGQADLDSVAVIRFDEQLGRAITQEFDAKAAMRGDPTQNISLQDNDVIVVNRNTIAKVSYILNTVTQPFRDVLGFLLFFDRLQRSAENLFSP
jgi:polysaccharide biosynthesis/export protein